MHDDDPPDEATRLAYRAQLNALDGQPVTVKVPSFILNPDGELIGMDVEEYPPALFVSRLHDDEDE